MAKVLVVTSGKGGVGKTTSTAALGAALQVSQPTLSVDRLPAAAAHHPLRSHLLRRGDLLFECAGRQRNLVARLQGKMERQNAHLP